MSVPRTSIYADPRAIGDAVGTAAVLSRILGFDEEQQTRLAGQLGESTRSFVYVARLLDDATAKAVIDLRLDGIGALSEPARMVTAGDLAASVIGTTNDFGEGSTGLELQYEDTLQGVDGESVTERDSAGRSLPGGSKVLKEPEPGEDLVLTIDRSIQYQAEQALVTRVQELQAAGGTAIIMDVHTGEIYALANVDHRRRRRGPHHVGQPRRGQRPRARLGRQGVHHGGGDQRGARDPGIVVHGARQSHPRPLEQQGLRHPRRRVARHDPDDRERHPRALEQHRHDDAVRPARAGEAGAVHAPVRARCRERPRVPRRVDRQVEALHRVAGQREADPLLRLRVHRDVDADDRRRQHDRQRRRVRRDRSWSRGSSTTRV